MALPRAPRESEYISPASEHEESLVSRTESGHLAGGLDSLCLKKDRRPRGAEGLYVRFGAFQGNSSREIVAPKIAGGAASRGTPRLHSMATSRCRPPHIREGLSPDLSGSIVISPIYLPQVAVWFLDLPRVNSCNHLFSPKPAAPEVASCTSCRKHMSAHHPHRVRSIMLL